MPHEEAIVHGTCVALGGRGVLLLGPPGAGKSDLALRLIDQSGSGISGKAHAASLVADDQVRIRKDGGILKASPPTALAGLEIRGLGIVPVRHIAEVPLGLAVRLSAVETVERLPDLPGSSFEVLGLAVPLVMIDAASASAPARIRAAFDLLASP